MILIYIYIRVSKQYSYMVNDLPVDYFSYDFDYIATNQIFKF